MSASQGWFRGRLTELLEDECLELLTVKQVGRLAYADQDGPVVVPVNYVLHDRSVLFRTSPHSLLGRNVSNAVVAFEVDDIDDVTESGWSVLVRGRAEYLDVDDLPTSDRRPAPWADGGRNLNVRIRPRSVTGRRLLAG
jgi:nitroimidazol reductase NimA-like FMN-containing flavoprotein (pyridoxamine 5'-phosphate oxidase superfamily)